MLTLPLYQRVGFRVVPTCEADPAVAAADDALAVLPGIVARRGMWPWFGGPDVVASARALAASHARRLATDQDLRQSPPTGQGVAFPRECHAWVEDWLMPFQREAIARLVALGGGHLWSSPGSGKTAMGIVWALSAPGPVVIVTRAGSRPTWERELRKLAVIEPWVGVPANERPKGAPSLEEYAANTSRPVFVLGYESLDVWAAPVIVALSALPPATLILDESHKAKQNKRKKSLVGTDGRNVYKDLGNTASLVEKLSRATTRRLGMTATPIPNRTRDLWAQLDLIQPGAWGTFHNWTVRYCDAKQGDWGWNRDGSSNEAELKTRLGAVTHAIPYSVSHGQLPPKRREVRFLRPDEQNKEAAGFAQELKLAAREERGNDSSRMKELKLTLAASRKRTYAIDEIREAVEGKGKVLVFTNRRKLRVALTEAVAKKLPDGVPLWGVDGDDSVTAREAARAAYMEHPGPCVFIATGDSMGEGVDFQDTDLFLVLMLPYTPGQLWQWENRVARLGQKRACIIRYVVAVGTYDEYVNGILLDKLPAVDAIVGDEAMAGVTSALEGVLGHEGELLDSLVEKITAQGRVETWADLEEAEPT